MGQIARIVAGTLIALVLLDLSVAAALRWGKETGRIGSLVRYFEYGRSVPGKLEHWIANPDVSGNLFDIAWRDEAVARSREAFTEEGDSAQPVIRSYGMSFVNNILQGAVELRPSLAWDAHAGPGAPPNFTYALFEDDRANRRPGDIAVLGILSSAVPAMAALSNSTWAFEQPAPFTYPIYRIKDNRLIREPPLIESADAMRRVLQDPEQGQAWYAQLSQQDQFYNLATYGLTWLDASPLMRLIRRAVATSHVDKVKRAILDEGAYSVDAVLSRMVIEFARTARADGQVPIVMLVQSRDLDDINLLAVLKSTLEQNGIPYFATAEHYDPRNPAGFLGDGHYVQDVDRLFAREWLSTLDQQRGEEP